MLLGVVWLGEMMALIFCFGANPGIYLLLYAGWVMGFLNYAWQPLARLSEGQVDSVVVATGLFAAVCRGGVDGWYRHMRWS
jgi:hypothetical protein